MAVDGQEAAGVLVWFEDNGEGRAALRYAYEIAEQDGADLTVLTVATQERVAACGVGMSGTVLWNHEMKKIAHEELAVARHMLDGASQISYETVIGDPVEAIADAAWRAGALTVVLPWHRNRFLEPPNRRDVCEKVIRKGPWQVIAGPQPARR